MVAARAAPSVTHSSRTRPSSSGPVGEVQLAADLVQHLDTVQHITVQYSTVQVQYSTVQEVHHLKSGSEHSIALTVSLQNSLGQIRNRLYFTVQEEAADDQSGLLCMMDTVMTRPRRFTLESGKRLSELLGLA